MLNKFYAYEKQLSPEAKTELGIVYTPFHIVQWINRRVLELWDKPTPPRVIDPCCGTGVFLYDMAQQISLRWSIDLEEVYQKYIFGSDLDKQAIATGKKLMPNANLCVENSLNLDFKQFDLIVTNPPYIRIQNLTESARQEIKKDFTSCKGDTDIYIAFFEKILLSGLIAGFICPNSWLKNKSASILRGKIKEENRLDSLIDFKSKKVFHGVGTYTSILIFNGQKTNQISVGNDLESLSTLNKSEVFVGDAILIDKKDQSFMKKILSYNTKIFDICNINVGLATLADDVFCVELVEKRHSTSRVRKRKKDSPIFEIENDIIIECLKGGDITKNKNKQYVIIYPYDTAKNLITESHLKTNFPLAFEYLAQNKERLLRRDKGKDKNYKWYEYGRTQSLNLIQKDTLVFPTMVKDYIPFKKCQKGTAFISGYCLVPKGIHNLNTLQELFSADEMRKWIAILGKNMGNEWKGISKETFKNYKIKIEDNQCG